MSDLIDRKEALKSLREIFTRGNGLRPATVDMINAIKFLPSAEPEKGKWIKNDNGTFSCSVCQSWIPEEQHYYARYCLYCGAKMEVAE